jgi:hypothetical protein
MADNNKPLFSRPVLAMVMLFCTLAIWVLSLTAPSSKLPTPEIEKWNTTSGIPVIWLKQTDWKNGDKLEIRFVFQSNTADAALSQTTLAMLMSNSLPLSTASINQRLVPLAAHANSHYDHESQIIGLTLSNQLQYLIPTLSLVTNWLKQPDFKQRTFDRWQRQHKKNSFKQTIEQLLFTRKNVTNQPSTEEHVTATTLISLDQVRSHYQALKSSSIAIYVIGDMPPTAKLAVEKALDTISQNYSLASLVEKSEKNQIDSQIIEINKQEKSMLWQSRSAVAINPLSSVTEWVSLQIWGADLVSTLNKQHSIDFVQLGLTLSAKRPWVEWNTQYANHLVTDENIQGKQDQQLAAVKRFVFTEKVPSFNDEKAFSALLETFKTQLEQQTQSPTWWSYIATQVTHEGEQLTLKEFANNYKEAIDTFTMEDYQRSLKHLLKPSTYQEIQVYQ